MGAEDFKRNKVPHFARKSVIINVLLSLSALALVPASRYYCDVNWSYMSQVSLGLKGFQRQAHDFKHNKMPLFARKPANINVLSSAATKLALMPASRYYCVVNTSNFNVCAKFH